MATQTWRDHREYLANLNYYVYRHLDGDGELLYVGCSAHLVNRMRLHRFAASWARDIAAVDIYGPLSRVRAFDLESNLIYLLQPRMNRRGLVLGDRGGSATFTYFSAAFSDHIAANSFVTSESCTLLCRVSDAAMVAT